jgi:hypothetical protein
MASTPDNPLLFAVAVGAVIVVVTGVSWVVLRLIRSIHGAADGALRAALSRYKTSSSPQPGYALVSYPTYVGALFTVREQVVSAWVPNSDAVSFLNSLLTFNFKRGLFTGFVPYVLAMMLFNYVVQRLRIRRQVRKAPLTSISRS